MSRRLAPLPRLGKYHAPVDEQTIARRLRELRKHRGLTQVELAEKVGIDQTLLSTYERGTVRIHGAMVAALAKALRTTTDELLGLKEPKENGLIKDRRFLRRLEQIERLPRRKKDALLTTIDAFLKQP
jgi:transcriptional regulator with XRE-family HTH domain